MKRFLTLFAFCFAFCPVSASDDLSFDAHAAQSFCLEKWTKRGVLDSNMFSYCMEQQSDGHFEAHALYVKYSLSINRVEMIDEIVRYAVYKWTQQERGNYQFNMVAYEIEKQSEAYLNVQYDLKNGRVDHAKLPGCKSKWLTSEEPLWNMVEYCLKD